VEKRTNVDSNRKKELKKEAALVKTYMGVYKLTNTQNGKIFINASINLKNQESRLFAQLKLGSHPNAILQRDFKQFGQEAFTFEILEQKETEDKRDIDQYELEKMFKVWFEDLAPYGDRGYNKKKS
jgi:hypothetical protein